MIIDGLRKGGVITITNKMLFPKRRNDALSHYAQKHTEVPLLFPH
jgi:hypothetical protein